MLVENTEKCCIVLNSTIGLFASLWGIHFGESAVELQLGVGDGGGFRTKLPLHIPSWQLVDHHTFWLKKQCTRLYLLNCVLHIWDTYLRCRQSYTHHSIRISPLPPLILLPICLSLPPLTSPVLFDAHFRHHICCSRFSATGTCKELRPYAT